MRPQPRRRPRPAEDASWPTTAPRRRRRRRSRGAGRGLRRSRPTGPRPRHHRSGRRRDPQAAPWRELPILVLTALVLAIIIKSFLVQAFFIPSPSMVPTLQPWRPHPGVPRVPARLRTSTGATSWCSPTRTRARRDDRGAGRRLLPLAGGGRSAWPSRRTRTSSSGSGRCRGRRGRSGKACSTSTAPTIDRAVPEPNRRHPLLRAADRSDGMLLMLGDNPLRLRRLAVLAGRRGTGLRAR